ncbi:triose-phosphate isomerase, partial [Enterococcus hirae]|nr:triose-phosphate isomerase [Enterococcus hirae]MCV3130046.1 triose-phosphate isomerase [Enterococcus hirae]MCV3132499.1 triose-phosphate isomerase [Enterococcus hirae]
SDISYMIQTNEAVRKMDPEIFVLQAAGISTVADVRKALDSGADATGGTSGIVCAKDPVDTLKAMIEEVSKWKKEQSTK